MGNNEQHDAGRSACHPAADAGMIGFRSDDARGQAGVVDSGNTTDVRNSPHAAFGRKAFEDLRARGARAGCSFYELAGGGYLITRWSMVREFPDLPADAELLDAMGVR